MQHTPDISSVVSTIAILALLGFAAWRDIATRTIPDTVSVMLLVVGLGRRLVQGWEPGCVSLLVALAVFTLLLPLCCRGLVGGADLKLLAALSAGLSPQVSVQLIAYVTVVGGALALLYLLLNKVILALSSNKQPRGRASGLVSRVVNVESWRIRRRAPLPYGIAIAVGTAFAVLNHQGV